MTTALRSLLYPAALSRVSTPPLQEPLPGIFVNLACFPTANPLYYLKLVCLERYGDDDDDTLVDFSDPTWALFSITYIKNERNFTYLLFLLVKQPILANSGQELLAKPP
jgi:hypothetical protein